jgi:hypothetical protein
MVLSRSLAQQKNCLRNKNSSNSLVRKSLGKKAPQSLSYLRLSKITVDQRFADPFSEKMA